MTKLKAPTRKEHEQFESYFIYQQVIDALITFVEILNINLHLLIAHIDKFESGYNETIMGIENEDKMQSYLLEAMRLLHNYVSSTYSLKEHTYTLCNKYKRLEGAELDKLKSLFSKEIVFIIQDLRTYIQHVGLKSITAQTKVNGEKDKYEEVFSLGIDVNELLSASVIRGKSKLYIKEKYEDETVMRLKPLIEAYQRIVLEYYKKFSSHYNKTFSKELKICKNYLDKQGALKDLFIKQVLNKDIVDVSRK